MRHDPCHLPTAHRSIRPGRRAAPLAALCAAALALLLLGAPPAPAAIDDTNAPPSWDYLVDGPAHSFDVGADIAMTGSRIWVCGIVQTTDHAADAALVRIVRESDDGVRLTTWDRSAHRNDENHAIAVRGSYIYTCGSTENAAGDTDLLVIRWSSSGQVKWAKTYAGSGHDHDAGVDVAVDSRGDVVVCGYQVGAHQDDWIVRKYSRSGKKLWTWKHDGPGHGDDSPAEMVIDSDRNVIVTGMVSRSETEPSAYTVKLSRSGHVVWDRRYDGASGDIAAAHDIVLAPSPRGAVYVVGIEMVTASDVDGFLLRYSRRGSRKVYDRADAAGGPSNEYLEDAAVTSDDKIVAVGSTEDGDEEDQYWSLWDAAGGIIAESAPATAGEDAWVAVATDSDRGVYMTGSRDSGMAHDEITTSRWSTTHGGSWWYSWADDPLDRYVSAIAVNGLGCAVAGGHETATAGFDIFVHVWQY